MYNNTDAQQPINEMVAAEVEQSCETEEKPKMERQLSYCPVGLAHKMLDVDKFTPKAFKKFKTKKSQVVEERLKASTTSLGTKNRNANLNAMNETAYSSFIANVLV
jgi:hypothetical protein